MTNFGLAKPIRRREAGEADELKARIDEALATLDDLLDEKAQATRRRPDTDAGTSSAQRP
ncbi:MAG TPA: hypothetical protein VMY34_07580 [Acidimicrobiales bacterium]|nr:hypothetical protein [Acidimicrobiales bacterium]